LEETGIHVAVEDLSLRGIFSPYLSIYLYFSISTSLFVSRSVLMCGGAHHYSPGKLEFRFEGRSEWDNLCSVFVAERWQGEAKESEEMRPYWFAISEIPYAEMWPDDSLWLPELLAGRELGHWRFRFDAHGRLLDCEQRIEPQPPAA
jgi:hypothetical protein